MQDAAYWAKRALQREEGANQKALDASRRLRAIYNTSAERLVSMTERVFNNFAKTVGVSNDEARKLLSVQETTDMLAALQDEYEKTGSRDALAKLNAPAYGYRINRLQAIRKAIDAESAWLNGIEKFEGSKALSNAFEESYYRTMYDTAQLAEQEISYSPLSGGVLDQALSNRWKGENYSERVWENTHIIAKEAGKIIDAGMQSGASVVQMSREILDLFDVAYYAAARLVRTEINRMHNDAAIESYKAMGIEEYIYLATLDSRTCATCGALDLKHFKVSEAKTGVNIPPIHPNDRCTTMPDMGQGLTGERIARNPVSNKTMYVPADMTYSQWKKQYFEEPAPAPADNNQIKPSDPSSSSTPNKVRFIKYEHFGYSFQGETTLQDATVYENIYGKEKVRVYVKKGIDLNKQHITPEQILNEYEKLPTALKQSVDVVELVDYRNPSDKYWQETYGIKDFRSFATGGNRKMTFFQNDFAVDDSEVGQIMKHESAHSLDVATGSPEKSLSQSQKYIEAVNEDNKLNKGAFTSSYAAQSYAGSKLYSEDLADGISRYLTPTEKFGTIFPNRSKIYEEALKWRK